jgi:hypothetical protein
VRMGMGRRDEELYVGAIRDKKKKKKEARSYMLEQRESLLPHSQTPNSCNLKQTQRERDGAAREQTQRERDGTSPRSAENKRSKRTSPRSAPTLTTPTPTAKLQLRL